MPIIDLQTIEKRELIPGYEVRFVHTENMTMAFWDIKAGSKLPTHSHIHEQISQVTEGKFELTVEKDTYVLQVGKVVIIPSNAKHSGIAITDCKVLDTFYPVREDYM